MRKPAIFSIAFMFMLASWMVACSPPPKPREFKSEAGRFVVMSPVALMETIKTVDTKAAGMVDCHIFLGEQGNASFFVSYTDYPETYIKENDPELILDGARSGMVGSVDGKLTSETKITLEGNPGRELLIDVMAVKGQEGTVKARIFMVKNRLYQILWIAPKSKISIMEADAFLDSLKLLG